MKIITTLLLILCSTAAFAKTAYVTDELKITLRTGESATHRIARMLPTGERLTVLSTTPATGYSKVRTSSVPRGSSSPASWSTSRWRATAWLPPRPRSKCSRRHRAN